MAKRLIIMCIAAMLMGGCAHTNGTNGEFVLKSTPFTAREKALKVVNDTILMYYNNEKGKYGYYTFEMRKDPTTNEYIHIFYVNGKLVGIEFLKY